MTEHVKGWPWGRALPARVGWFREALALQRARPKPEDKPSTEREPEQCKVHIAGKS